MDHPVDIQGLENWLAVFSSAIESESGAALGKLLADDVYWRDVVALSWDIRTVSGRARVTQALLQSAPAVAFHNLHLDTQATSPRWVMRAGIRSLELFVRFETRFGHCRGVMRLRPDAPVADDEAAYAALRGWTFATMLDELHGFAERAGANRPGGRQYARNFRGPNWLDERNRAQAFEDRDPAVLVVGGGQAGLSIAARLGVLGLDTLVLEKNPAVGDNWRNRYHSLTLHNQVYANHLPYMPFPPNWPVYIPKDKLANWLESYAQAMELNVWTSSELVRGSYQQDRQCWVATVRLPDGRERTLKPRHIVMATSVSGIPNIPDIPALKPFAGDVIHASAYRDGVDHTGKSVLVLGAGTSAHDIAQDLASSGANVHMMQRGATMIVNLEPGAQLPYSLYHEGPSLEECDLITTAMPFPLMRRSHVAFTAKAREQDWPLLQALMQRGMTLDYGPDETGWQFKFLTRGGGYYFNVGASELIADGTIGLLKFDNIRCFTESAVEMTDGRRIALDMVVLATGYQGMSAMVERFFGTAVADQVGPIWGFDTDGLELRNMYCRTPQPGLWFIAGSFAQCRINSKYLALQIRAAEAGLVESTIGGYQPGYPSAPVQTSVSVTNSATNKSHQ